MARRVDSGRRPGGLPIPAARPRLLLWLLPAAALAWGALAATGDEPLAPDQPAAAPRFLRFHERDDADALQSAVVSYQRPRAAQRVTLVGAVHIGDPAYFAALQKILDGHDVVLFEGVGKGARREDLEAILFLQRLQIEMGRFLDLAYQQHALRYDRAHFRHADLSWDELQRELRRRGQTLFPAPFLKLVGPLLTKFLASQSASLERSGRKSAVAADVKRSVARMLADPNALLGRWNAFLKEWGIKGADQWEEVVISVRNDAAFRVLDAALAEGARSVAVLYGAAHLADMDRRLRQRGFVVRSHRWLDAWRIPKAAS